MGRPFSMELTDDDEEKLKTIVDFYGVQFDSEGVRIALTLTSKGLPNNGLGKEVK
jgi:hypothetical protein